MRVNEISWALTDLRDNLDAFLEDLDAKYTVGPGESAAWESWVEGDTFGVRRGDRRGPDR
jgi:hypothetical protein